MFCFLPLVSVQLAITHPPFSYSIFYPSLSPTSSVWIKISRLCGSVEWINVWFLSTFFCFPVLCSITLSLNLHHSLHSEQAGFICSPLSPYFKEEVWVIDLGFFFFWYGSSQPSIFLLPKHFSDPICSSELIHSFLCCLVVSVTLLYLTSHSESAIQFLDTENSWLHFVILLLWKENAFP